MQLSTDSYEPRLATSRHAGAWFRDLDFDRGMLRALFDFADTTLLHDGSVVLDANVANERIFGRSAEGLIGTSIFQLLNSSPSPFDLPSLPQGTAARARLAKHKDGSSVPVLAHEVPAWCHGRAVKLLAVRKARKARATSTVPPMELAQVPVDLGHDTSLSLPPGGSLAVVLGIAHDLNGVLTTLLTGLDLIERRGMDGTVHKFSVDACRRATTLVSELLMVGMGVQPESPLTSLDGAIRRGVWLAARDAPVDVVVEVQEGLWPVYVNEARFERIVYNLVLNAVQAMPEGGTLEVTGCNTSEHPLLCAGLMTGRAVRISVKDTGPGIPCAALPSIFEPYFTTKPRGKGIGLATCRALTREAGGDITVESMAGEGTSFHIFLPAGVHSERSPSP